LNKLGLDKEEYKLFVKDALNNCIVVGGFCKNNCIFCSCRAQSAAGLKNWTKYISMDDMLSIVDYINPNNDIYFGEGFNFLSCEPFQHPNYIEMLRELDKLFPNTTKKTTSICKWIKPEDYKEINSSNLQIVAGINTLNKEKRLEIMKSEDDYDNLLSFLKECKESIFKVSLLYVGDLDVLKEDLDMLYSIDDYYRTIPIMLRLTDHSRFHDKATIDLHHYSKKTWHEAVRYFDKNVINPSYWLRSLSDFPSDVKEVPITYNIHHARKLFINKMNKIINKLGNKINNSVFLLSDSVYDYFVKQYPDLNSLRVENKTFGGSYTSSLLLTKNDILHTINCNKKFQNYIVNKEMFSNYKKDLMGNSILNEKYDFNLILA